MTTLIVNYTELRFTSEVEMTRYLSQTEEIWNEEVMDAEALDQQPD